MLHCGKAVSPYCGGQHNSGRPTALARGKRLAPVAFLGFNLNKVG
jgi:hypothetical protein